MIASSSDLPHLLWVFSDYELNGNGFVFLCVENEQHMHEFLRQQLNTEKNTNFWKNFKAVTVG